MIFLQKTMVFVEKITNLSKNVPKQLNTVLKRIRGYISAKVMYPLLVNYVTTFFFCKAVKICCIALTLRLDVNLQGFAIHLDNIDAALWGHHAMYALDSQSTFLVIEQDGAVTFASNLQAINVEVLDAVT